MGWVSSKAAVLPVGPAVLSGAGDRGESEGAEQNSEAGMRMR